jgi:transmembrane sensor
MMAHRADQERLDEAIGWRIRLRDGGPEDWDAFVAWLEGDPARSAVYDEVALADTGLRPDMLPAQPARSAANDDQAHPFERRGGRRWASALAAVAAVLLIALVAWPWLSADSGLYEVATGPGRQLSVKLGKDGGTVALNGASRVRLDRGNERFAELVSGEALFSLRHDPARPFTLLAGGHEVRDTGTVFNVVRDGGFLSVEVAEGSVLFDPAGAALPLRAGETLAMRDTGGRIVLGRKAPQAVAGWRRGQLSYNQAPLADVARDLSRSMGMHVELDPRIAGRSFTGTIRIDASPSLTMERLAATLGMQARRIGRGWLIEPSRRARR